MRKVRKLYLSFWHPGTMVAEQSTREIDSIVEFDPKKVEWPKSAYAFRLFERFDVLDGAATFKGEPNQLGPTYYHPDSRVETIDEVRANKNATSILVRNMQTNGWKLIIWSRWGNWPQPFDPDKDTVIA